MKLECPNCHEPIASEEMNIAANAARCRRCSEVFNVSELLSPLPDVDPSNPPAGTWREETMGGRILGATTRSGAALFLIPFMLVWSGGSLGGIYGSQIAQGKFNLEMSLFGLPFLAGSLFLGSIAAMAVFGKVVVCLGQDSWVFVGVGPFGWRKHFDLDRVQQVRVEATPRQKSGVVHSIVIEADPPVRFGSGLSQARLAYLHEAIRGYLRERGGGSL